MPREKRQLPGEIRDGLVMYEGGTTWHYLVRWRGKIKRGDTKCVGKVAAAEWLKVEKKKWPLEEQGLIGPNVLTLRWIWSEWDRLNSNLSKSHIRWMKGVVHTHAAAFLDRPASDLTKAAFEEMKHTYLTTKGQGFSRGEKPTVRDHTEGGWNKVAGQLRALYRWAVDMKMILAVPFAVKPLPVSLEAKGVLWPEQVQRFLAVVDKVRKERDGDPVPQAGIAVRLMIGLGLRENEALHMEWDRLDWHRHLAIVAMTRTTKKKVKDRTVREIPMPDWLEPYLLKWWAWCGRPSAGLVLVPRKAKVHGEGSTKKAVQKGAKALGITNMTPHSLRYTFATGHYEIDTPLSQIQQMLGHEKPETTWGYILQRPKDQAEAQNKLGKSMGFSVVPIPDTVPLEPKAKRQKMK